MEIFSSREIAIGVWLCVAAVYTTGSKKLRPHVKHLIACFFNFHILTPILGLGLYIIAISYLLIDLGFWDYNQYKNATLWFVFVGVYALFQVADSSKGGKYFRETISDLLKLTTLFEFVVTFYSFNFWFELIFIPFMTLIVMVSTYSKSKEEYKVAHDFIGKIISFIGVCVIAYVCFLLVKNPGEFFSEGTVYDFGVPILLTLGVFPYLYVFMIYVEYESFFRRLSLKFKDESLVRHAKYRVALYFNFNLSHLKRWERYVSFHNVRSVEDVNDSINRVRYLLKRDKRNIPVSFEDGWSHYEARRYLRDYGLTTSYYDHLYDGKWSASSEPLKLGEGIFSNKITYYIDGDEDSVKCLTLVFDVDDTELLETDLPRFKEIGDFLFKASIDKDKGINIEIEEVEEGESKIYQTITTECGGRQIMIQKWSPVNRNVFELRLSFAVDKESFKYLDTL